MLLEEHKFKDEPRQEVMALIKDLLGKILMAEKLLYIKGAGIETVSSLLPEVGDAACINESAIR